MTYEKIVEQIKQAYEKADMSSIKTHAAIQFNVTGDGSGAFYLEISEGKANVQPYEYFDRDLLVTASAGEIINIAKGKLNPVKAYEAGKIAADGNLEVLPYIAVKSSAGKPKKKTVKPVASKKTNVVTKAEFVELLADKAGINKSSASAVVDAYAQVISEELGKGGKVQLVGFGTFETATRAARTGRNPFTGETIEIPAKTTLKFKAGKALKNELN